MVIIAPIVAGTDVLKMYGGVLADGVGSKEFGRLVATVARAEEKNEEISVAFWAMVVTLLSG